MRKPTIMLAVLAFLPALLFIMTSGVLSILSGLVTLGFVICALCVQTAGLVDENYRWISDRDASIQQTLKAAQIMTEASFKDYPYRSSTTHHSFSNPAQ